MTRPENEKFFKFNLIGFFFVYYKKEGHYKRFDVNAREKKMGKGEFFILSLGIGIQTDSFI